MLRAEANPAIIMEAHRQNIVLYIDVHIVPDTRQVNCRASILFMINCHTVTREVATISITFHLGYLDW